MPTQLYNPLPNIDTCFSGNNPILTSPTSTYGIGFYQTRESLIETDVYRAFLKNIESRFRHSVMYKGYKNFLYENGIDHCQIHGNINSEMASLEMHHALITLFDIALIISESLLTRTGYVSTFDVVQLIKDEHRQNNIALVMLSKTPHQVYHDAVGEFVIHPDMYISKRWPIFLEKYQDGITQDVAFKIIYSLKRAIEEGATNDQGLLDLVEKIKDWSNYHE